MIQIDVTQLQELFNLLNQHQPYTIEEEVLRILTDKSRDAIQISSTLGNISFYAQSVTKRYLLVKKHIDESIHIYENLETTIQKEAGVSIQTPTIKTQFFHTNYDTHTSLSSNKNLYSYWKNGICMGGSVAFSAIDFNMNHQSSYVNASLNADILKSKASIDGRIKFSDNGKTFNPSLIVSGKGSVALVQSDASLSLGNDIIHADVAGNLGIGVAQAEGKCVISANEIVLKGDVGASALKVSGKGSISIFGVTFSVTASTSVGSVGVGAEFTVKEGKFSIGANASLFAGIGIKFDIDY